MENFKFLSVSTEAKDFYVNMYKEGAKPSSAHSERKSILKHQFLDSWTKGFANRCLLPNIFCVYIARIKLKIYKGFKHL